MTVVAGGAASNPASGTACGALTSTDSDGDGCLGTAVKLSHPTGLALDVYKRQGAAGDDGDPRGVVMLRDAAFSGGVAGRNDGELGAGVSTRGDAGGEVVGGIVDGVEVADAGGGVETQAGIG